MLNCNFSIDNIDQNSTYKNNEVIIPVTCIESNVFHILYAVYIHGYKNPTNSRPGLLTEKLVCHKETVFSIPSSKIQPQQNY